MATIDRRLLLLLLCAPLLGLIGVVAADLVPNDPIADNLVGADAAEQIGPSDANATPLGTSAACYTECTSFSLGLGTRPGANVLTNAMRSPAYTGCSRLDAASRRTPRPARCDLGFRTCAIGTGTPWCPVLRWHCSV